jgi:peroxiredoxin/phosphoribosyl 1,2-cyclic phosphodiesterase
MRHLRPLAVGQLAPNFHAPVTGGAGTIRLSDFRGQCMVILAFYPGDWTDVCTQEMPLIEEYLTLAELFNVQVLGVSVDSIASHNAYIQHIGLNNVRLISDFDRSISRAYGVLRPEGFCERATVIIDEAGCIAWQRIEPDIQRQRALDEVRAVIAGLRGRPDLAVPDAAERAAAVQITRAAPLAPPTRLRLKFWGTRGSIPTCGPAFVRYGGNTSCVSLESDTGHLFIFDSGTGIRDLGLALQPNHGPAPAPYDQLGVKGYLLLSHTHWDHIQGFPFFEPAFNPRNHFNVIGCSNCARTLASLLAGQMEQTYFPISMEVLAAQFEFHSFCNTAFALEGAQVTVRTLKHPNPSTAFRIDLAGRSVVYATDHEMLGSPPVPLPEDLSSPDILDPQLLDLAAGADCLIHDAQYTAAEYEGKVGWGHSTVETAVDTAIRAGVRRLYLFHHDPQHTDADLDAMLALARRRAARLAGSRLAVFSAADGDEWTF